MDAILNIYHSVPPFVWAFVFGTPFIVGFVNVCKKLFGVNSTFVIHTLTITTSFLLTAIPEYVLNNPKPFTILGAYTTAFFTTANFLYAITKRLAPFFQAVQAYETKKAAAASSTLDVATPASVSATVAPTVVQIPVTDPTVFEG